MTKIIYPDIYEHQSFSFDKEKYLSANTSYFIPVEEDWLTALLNSGTIEWFYRNRSNAVRGGYLRAFTETMQYLPVPAPKSYERKGLAQLTQRAAESEVPALAAIEAEINQIVYRLFDLTPEEIRLVESTINSEPREYLAPEEVKGQRTAEHILL